MNLSKPLTSLIPTLEGEVLTVLAGAQLPFSGLQVQRIIGKYSPRGVRDALQRLCVQGIVTRQSAGAADLYELNPGHLMAKYITSLVSLRSEFLQLLEKEVAAWPILPLCGAVFGSAVRSDMKPESDIDIFIVRPQSVEFGLGAWREQLSGLSRKIGEWTGNNAQIFELDADGINLELASQDGILYSIIEQGVLFYGAPNYLRTLRYKKASNKNG